MERRESEWVVDVEKEGMREHGGGRKGSRD